MSNIPNLALMIRPLSFGFNQQTSASNHFQQMDLSSYAEQAKQEFDAMVETLRSNNVAVKVFEDQQEGLPDSVFPNNWIAQMTTGEVIVFPMYTANRKAEIREDVIAFVKGLKNGDLLDFKEEVQVVEGTGSIVFDYENQLAFACESVRTDIPLFEKICGHLNYRPISFLSTDTKGFPIYHTNVMMTIAAKYALVCLDSIENSIEKIMVKKTLESVGKMVIPISFAEMNNFACNAIELLDRDGNSVLIMSEAATSTLSEHTILQINNYSRIISIKIPTIERIGGGSVRCMIAGLFS